MLYSERDIWRVRWRGCCRHVIPAFEAWYSFDFAEIVWSMADPLFCVSLRERVCVCACVCLCACMHVCVQSFSVWDKEGQWTGQPLRSEKAYGHSMCVCVWPASMHMCTWAGVCQKSKVSEIFRQTLLILQGSLRSAGGRIRIHLAALSGGRRDTINNKSAGVTGPALQSQENGRVSSIPHTHTHAHTHTAYIEYTLLYTYTYCTYTHSVFSAPCCQCVMPAVITCFILSAWTEWQWI